MEEIKIEHQLLDKYQTASELSSDRPMHIQTKKST